MIKGFVFGKFLPFHNGHEALIRFALTQCDFLTVLICCSEKENVSGTIRKNWIETTLHDLPNVEVNVFDYLESDLPNTSVSSLDVSKIWSAAFLKMFPDYDLVITSEDYGNYIAEFMGIKHITFDKSRKLIPVSATAIRHNLFKNWQFLPKSVKPHYAIKVVILGTESTGKTTLSKKLAEHFKCTMVAEAGRELIEDSNSFQFSDLNLVASEQFRRIDEATTGESALVIIDTDIHITKSYSEFIFGKQIEIEDEFYTKNNGNLFLYLNNDVDYIQDGTRLTEKDRNTLDLSHRKILAEHSIEFIEIKGNWQTRFEKALSEIEQFIIEDRVIEG